MILRDFTCAVCGAPRETTEGALVVFCRHCGAILTFTGEGLWRSTALAERHAEGIAQLVKPTAAQARLTALMLEMARATAPEDRARWRLLAEEQIVVQAIAHPWSTAPIPTEPDARRRHVANAVVMSELATFDPGVAARMHAYGAAAGALTAGDPVAAARAMLDAARAYYEALAEHPDLPPGALREGAEHFARELVRAAVQGYAPLLGDRAVERIRTEVLGDAAGAGGCPNCGAPLDAAGLARCGYCGAVTSVDEEDAWTTAQLALWEISRVDLVRRGELQGAAPVLAALAGFLYTGARDVAPEKAFAFLQRAIGWLSREEVTRGFDLLAHGATREQAALLRALRDLVERSWPQDPSLRPAAHVARTAFPPPTPDDEAAWIASALGLWNFQRGSLLVMLSHPLNGMQVAAVHEQPTGITPRAAVAFFDRAWPGYDRAALVAELEKLTPGYDHPRVRAFATELARLLRGR